MLVKKIEVVINGHGFEKQTIFTKWKILLYTLIYLFSYFSLVSIIHVDDLSDLTGDLKVPLLFIYFSIGFVSLFVVQGRNGVLYCIDRGVAYRQICLTKNSKNLGKGRKSNE